MKNLLTLLMLVISMTPYGAFASRVGYGGNGIQIISNSSPEVVATLSDRDAIPSSFRAERMYCYVADNHKVYQLRGGVTNAHWVELDIASSMKIQGPPGTLPYIDATGLLATDMRYLGKAKYDFSGANFLGSGQYISVNGINNIVNDRSHNIINAFNSFSDGNYVLMMGERDSALGQGGVILGSDITLRANQQFAAGSGLIGQTNNEVLFGRFNKISTSTSQTWQNQDPLFTLGNGANAQNRSNAMIVYKNGDAVFSGDLRANNLYTKLQIDSMFVVNGSGGGGGGVVQSIVLNGTSLTITGGNTVNFQGWDTDASDDFSGDYNDLSNLPTIFSGDYNDLLNKPFLFSGNYNDLANKPSFNGWDSDASDDFSGNFNDLTNVPALFSGNYNDLTNLPTFTGWDMDVTDDFSGNYNDLINLPTFTGWDTDVTDDFSGDFNDLINVPTMFSGNYNDLINLPTFTGWDTDVTDDFSGNYNDLTNRPSFAGWDQDASDDFSGNYNDLSNLPTFTGWDTDVTDDFSGNFNDLFNVPALFSGNYNDLSNLPTFTGWDTDVTDDFSGDYNDLINAPTLFSGNYNDLSNLPTFTGWDTDVTDDFSGDYNDLTNQPNFGGWDTDASDDFTGNYNDLYNVPVLFSGRYNDLTNRPNFTGWDTDASDDFSGNYNDLVNQPSFAGWDMDASDDFSGNYNDLVNLPSLFSGDYADLANTPALYTKLQVDSMFVVNGSGGGGGTIQTLNLTNGILTITGGNNVNMSAWDRDASDDFSGNYNDLTNIPTFTGWDTDASDDFDGDYNSLTNRPALFSGDYNALSNIPTFSGWDTDASDDFDGDYNSLTNRPALFSGDYNLLVNKPTFSGWDTDASDDFSGNYMDLINRPDVYSKPEVDSAIAANAGGGGLAQNLTLVGNNLSISGGNNVNFTNWDMDATDDFSGDFGDLTSVPADFQDGSISWAELSAKPQLYNQSQVDSIKQNILDSMTAYVDSAVISQAHSELTGNRSLTKADCGKTVYVKSNTAVIKLPVGMNIPFNSHIELRDFGSGSLILNANGVILRDASGDVIAGNTSAIIIEDAAITAIGTNEYKIIGLYQ